MGKDLRERERRGWKVQKQKKKKKKKKGQKKRMEKGALNHSGAGRTDNKTNPEFIAKNFFPCRRINVGDCRRMRHCSVVRSTGVCGEVHSKVFSGQRQKWFIFVGASPQIVLFPVGFGDLSFWDEWRCYQRRAKSMESSFDFGLHFSFHWIFCRTKDPRVTVVTSVPRTVCWVSNKRRGNAETNNEVGTLSFTG